MSGSGDERDLAAAEYVLGTLDAESAEALARAAEADPAVAAAIAAWERRLGPLARLVPPVDPPADLWPRIAAATAPATPPRPRFFARAWQSLGFWRLATGGALAFAALLAGFMVLRQPARPPVGPMYMASIRSMGSHKPMFVAEMRPGGGLMVRALAPMTVAQGRAFELWAKPAGAKTMTALGMVPASGRRVRLAANVGDGTELMISIEPARGAPGGAPSGPMLYEGRLTRVD
jgi:anti-sigma-K factor RskA